MSTVMPRKILEVSTKKLTGDQSKDGETLAIAYAAGWTLKAIVNPFPQCWWCVLDREVDEFANFEHTPNLKTIEAPKVNGHANGSGKIPSSIQQLQTPAQRSRRA